MNKPKNFSFPKSVAKSAGTIALSKPEKQMANRIMNPSALSSVMPSIKPAATRASQRGRVPPSMNCGGKVK